MKIGPERLILNLSIFFIIILKLKLRYVESIVCHIIKYFHIFPVGLCDQIHMYVVRYRASYLVLKYTNKNIFLFTNECSIWIVNIVVYNNIKLLLLENNMRTEREIIAFL